MVLLHDYCMTVGENMDWMLSIVVEGAGLLTVLAKGRIGDKPMIRDLCHPAVCQVEAEI